VPKTGKGKYNVTVPQPFEFMNQEKGFSIRQKKVEQMIYEKIRIEERALAFQYKATEIPKHVKDRKYERLQLASLERRSEAKRLAVAKIKATEAPFKFYERDMKVAKKKLEDADLPASMGLFEPFRAGKIPWKVLVPLYNAMVEDGENERIRRIKKNS
jgi:hypothetical protein